MTSTRPLLSLMSLIFFLGIVNPVEAKDASIVMRLFLPNAMREPVAVKGQALVYSLVDSEAPIRLSRLRIVSDGVVLVERALSDELFGDERYKRLEALRGRLRANSFSADEADIQAVRWSQLHAELLESWRHTKRRPFARVRFELPVDELFAPGAPVDEARDFAFEVEYVDADGQIAQATVSHTISTLASFPSDHSELPGITIHPGDLHVHSCHGEPGGGCDEGDPNLYQCDAETGQIAPFTNGMTSFTYDELKSEYGMIGADWFAATDHSYCVDNDAEYTAIKNEIALINDVSFVAFPDLELSSDEAVAANPILDVADASCATIRATNHIGAHGIDTRINGGTSSPFPPFAGGWCVGLSKFQDNVKNIRNQGGYPIVHHPAGPAFGFESKQQLRGIESNSMHGVEIWNGEVDGETRVGQNDSVAEWVNWLLDGRVLYAYSGSDTHDAPPSIFGWNHVVLDNLAFTSGNIQDAIRQGRVFLSNRDTLILEVVHDGTDYWMGSRVTPSPLVGGATVTVKVYYNVTGPSAVTAQVFRGRVGDPSEGLPIDTRVIGPGEGSYQFTNAVTYGRRSWYRAYSQSTDMKTAYTNPVFIEPPVTIEFVEVEDPGNACDVQTQGCFGSVSYPYRISKYMITYAQYAEYLNRVAVSDPNELYHPIMADVATAGGIVQSGAEGNFSYSTIPGRENWPVVWVNFHDSLRFANWLYNGQPTGPQGVTTTEGGAYTITPVGIASNSITRNNIPAILPRFIPTEDEWYKAAYYDADAMVYFDYPGGSDDPTVCQVPTSTPNRASCNGLVIPHGPTEVGAYPGTPSPSGTFDQGGSAWEWSETIVLDDYRLFRGGSWGNPSTTLAASTRTNQLPYAEDPDSGIRIVEVPEPEPTLLLLSGVAGLLVAHRIHRRSSRSAC